MLLGLAAGGSTAPAADKIVVTYYGHACFAVTTPERVHVLIDPFSKNFKYAFPSQKADVVLISHELSDHNNFEDVAGYPIILHGLKLDGSDYEKVDFRLRDLHVTALPSFHDDAQGAKRGKNTIFILDVDRFRLVHLGDLGVPLTPDERASLGHVRVLMIPVGGLYTIDAPVAARLIADLAPDIAIPMHYRTAATKEMPIDSVDAFLKLVQPVFRPGTNTLELEQTRPIAKPGIYVLEPR